jgi:hypothetical protein
MHWTGIYAMIVAAILTVIVVTGSIGLLRRPRPQRGPGAAYGILVLSIVLLVVVLHGSIVSGIALALNRNPVTWSTVGLHGLVILWGLVRTFWQ